MKKFLTIVIILAIVVAGGGWYAKRLLTDKISDKVVSALNSPTLKQQINKAIANPEVKANRMFKYVMNHTSPSEDVKLLQAYNHRDSLTSEQKKELAQESTAKRIQ